jgi:2-polyprenyl-3-methyl-5-hydroxy-6-metoxy-1,4-benzoquinol methylase
MQADLHERRIHAAKLTKGASSLTIYRMVVELAAAHISNHAEILDFGAGTGTLMRMLREAGFHGRLAGADILPRPPELDHRTEWFQCDLNEPLAAPQSFDAIVSAEVIEHLENPRALFREFARLLRPGGILLLTTPNQESVRSLLSLAFRGHFVDFLDSSYPAHVTALLPTDLRRLCAESGFSPPQFSYTGAGGFPGAPRVSWQQISGGMLRGRRFSDNLAMVTAKRTAL